MTYAYVLVTILIIGAVVVAANLFRSLKSGVATLRMVSVSRDEDSTIYWFYIGAMLFGLTFFLYFTALFLALIFPDAGLVIWPMKS